MSLSNMMPDKPRKARGDRDKAAKFNRAAAGSEESEDESEYSGSESEESEEDAPIRRRAARNVTYNMKEYDDMMKSAIDDGKVKYSAEEMEVRIEIIIFMIRFCISVLLLYNLSRLLTPKTKSIKGIFGIFLI